MSQEGLPLVATPTEISTAGLKVLDQDGKEIVRPDVIAAVVQLAQLSQLSRIRKAAEREYIEGKLDTRTLAVSATPHSVALILEPPYKAWATASFVNDGGDRVYIAINQRGSPVTLEDGESFATDYTKADRRIEFIWYWCDVGETAAVRAIGKY